MNSRGLILVVIIAVIRINNMMKIILFAEICNETHENSQGCDNDEDSQNNIILPAVRRLQSQRGSYYRRFADDQYNQMKYTEEQDAGKGVVTQSRNIIVLKSQALKISDGHLKEMRRSIK